MRDYNGYELSLQQKLISMITGAVLILGVAFIFYRSFVISAAFLPLAFLCPGVRSRSLCKRTKKELNIQFKDLLYSLSSSASAGKTMEGCFREAGKDLEVLYPYIATPINIEIKIINRKLDLNENLEDAIFDFAKRSGLEDIRNFAEVFKISKRSGANMAEVIRNASGIINDRIEIEQEIETMMAEKNLEQKVLNAIPVIMVLLLSITAPEYMQPVFETTAGRLVMTVSLFVFALAWFISRKISDIYV